MSDYKFTSPGIKFRERSIQFVTQTVGTTTLGLVGETLKGPAFEPVFIQDKKQFQQRFGGQSTAKFQNGGLKYQTPYVANAYLEESDQLYVTRVLGLSGYNEGTSWVISMCAGLDPTKPIVVNTESDIDIPFSGFVYSVPQPFNSSAKITNNGQTGTVRGITNQGSVCVVEYRDFTVTSLDTNGNGTLNEIITTLTGTAYEDFSNATAVVLRSRATMINNLPVFDVNEDDFSVEIVAGLNDTLLGSYDINIYSNGDLVETYNVSLNPLASNYIVNVLGNEPTGKKTKLYVESIFPEMITYAANSGIAIDESKFTGVSLFAEKLNVEINTINTTNYATKFKTPETPWVVSELKGSTVERLFKFVSISDGNSANAEIKISIENINVETQEFDVIIRDFNDTDASKVVLEAYTRCTLIPSNTNYIAKKIGTTNEDYTLNSKYVMLELAENISPKSFPCGFEGYYIPDYINLPMIYKTAYGTEKVVKTYLGISNTVFDSDGINQNLFNFNGFKNDDGNTEGFIKTKGFHLDSNATGNYLNDTTFVVGAGKIQTLYDVLDINSTYADIKKRKFTLVPAGGFDGWNAYENKRTYGDSYKNGLVNDFQAWTMAINTFANPEAVTINLFAVPSINWSDHTVLVQNTIDMIEEERTDSMYIIDAPDTSIVLEVGESKPDVIAAKGLADDLNNTEIDSSYGATYVPWVQIKDSQNGVNIYLPPTGEVVKAIAYNDRVKAPWWAVAGLNRGVTAAKKSKFKMSQDARDILQPARINPMVDFPEVGTAIFGQKTLEISESPTNSMNIRRLILQTKVLISNIAIRLLFEPNDQTAIDEFLNKVNPILDKIKRERGLYEFAVKMDSTINSPESIDRDELYGEIYLKPMRTIEKIGIGFTLTPTGASFKDL